MDRGWQDGWRWHVLTTDKKSHPSFSKSIKIAMFFIHLWIFLQPAVNFASITPASDLADVHHIPSCGSVVVTANEGIQMSTYYIPQLGACTTIG